MYILFPRSAFFAICKFYHFSIFFAKYTFFIYSILLQIASSSYIWIFVIDQIAYHKFVPCSIFFATDFLLFPWWSPSLQLAACSILTCTIQSNELKVYLLFCLWFNAVEEHTRSACFMMFTTALTLSIKILSQLAFFSAEGGRNHASESRTNKQVLKEKQQFLSTSIWKVQEGTSKDLFLRNIIHKLLYMKRHHGYRHWIEISHENHRLHFLVPIISNDILQVVFKDALDAFLKKAQGASAQKKNNR